jgi:hypothetical protein
MAQTARKTAAVIAGLIAGLLVYGSIAALYDAARGDTSGADVGREGAVFIGVVTLIFALAFGLGAFILWSHSKRLPPSD